MRPIKDYAGTRWGRLLCVETLNERQHYGTGSYSLARCVCDCGDECVVLSRHAVSGRYNKGCDKCRVKKCVICSKIIVSKFKHQTNCSAECRRIQGLRRALANRRKLSELRKFDPVCADRYRKWRIRKAQRRLERLKTDLEFAARELQRNREYYRKNKEALRLRFREKLKSMSLQEREQFMARVREKSRRYYHRRPVTPELIEKNAARLREFRRSAALEKMASEIEQIADYQTEVEDSTNGSH